MMRALMLILFATPAAAQEATFALPQGCTAYVTAQLRNCSVSHYFRCEGDPEGWQRRVDLDDQGLTYEGATDNEGQWMESYHVRSGHTEALGPRNDDPASFSELLSKGVDSYDFDTTSPQVGTQSFVGEDRLTGKTLTVNGVTLEETEYHITATAEDGSVEWASAGHEYISRDWRVFFSGVSTITTPSDSYDEDGTPMAFAFPGDPGFLTTKPQYGCGTILSSLVR